MTLTKPTPGGNIFGSVIKTPSNMSDTGAASGHVYSAPAPAQAVPTDLGNISLDPSNPSQSAQNVVEGGANIFEGLKNFVLGTSQPDYKGNHGGLLGGIPIVSDLARAGTEVAANAVGAVGAVAGGAVSALANIPLPSAENVGAEYDQIPQDDPNKLNAEIALNAQRGIFGTGIGGESADAIKGHALAAYKASLQSNETDLYSNLFVPTVSVGDAVSNLFGNLIGSGHGGVIGLGERTVERAFSGFDSIREGMDQVDMILAVGNGQAGWHSDWTFDSAKQAREQSALSPVEAHVFDMVNSGKWTHEQGLDYISSHGRGFSHDTLSQIAGSIAFDPVQDAAIVMSAGVALGLKGMELTAGVRAAEGLLQSARGVSTLSGAERTAELANLGMRGLTDISGLSEAEQAAQIPNLIAEAQVKLNAATQGLAKVIVTDTDSIHRLNIMGRLMQTDTGSQIVRTLSMPYVEAQGTAMGKAFKIARTIVDPMSSFKIPAFLGGDPNGMIDLTTELISRTSIDGAYGRRALQGTLDIANQIDSTGALADQVAGDMGTMFANQTRELIATMSRDNNIANMAEGMQEIGEDGLLKNSPNRVLADQIANARKPILQKIKENANKYIIRVWTEEDLKSLAVRAERAYGTVSEDAWLQFFKGASAETRSLWHAATYGHANEDLFSAVANIRKGIADGSIVDKGLYTDEKLNRLVLLRRGTLTNVGAQGILDDIAAMPEIGDQIAHMRASQALYPELNYISVDATDLRKTIADFTKFVKKTQQRLPAQVMDEEFALHPELRDLQDSMAGAFTLGFRPDQKFIWGMELTGDGWQAVGNVFVDHVSTAGQQFRAAQAMGFSPTGAPIWLKKPMDWVTAAASEMFNSVSGSMISETARQKFVGNLSIGWASHDVNKKVAQDIWDGIQQLVEKQRVVVNPRGFDAGTIYDAIKDLIPPEARHAGLKENEVLDQILTAYQGDMRQVGLTQYMTGRAKKVLFEMTGSNMVGQISEMAWPLMKFRVNAVFQGQERIEGFILNAQRGVDAALGATMTPTDELTDLVLRRSVEKSLVRMGDVDISEQNAQILFGSGIHSAVSKPGSKLAKLRDGLGETLNVSGNKRLNLLRTFRKGLGQELRQVWDSTYPGKFDDMLNEARLKAGYMISEDNFAVSLVAEHQLGNDIAVTRALQAGGKYAGLEADYIAAVATGMWHTPSHFGELKALEMDAMAKLLNLGGSTDLKGLKASIARGDTSIDDVTKMLRMYNSDPDYIRRVSNALTFNYDDFLTRLTEAFKMTPDQREQFHQLIGGIAAQRKMTPSDYLSQVFAPNIIGGRDVAIGALGDAANIIVAGRQEVASNLAKFAAGDQSGFDDLIRQFSKVYAAHLDPSLKKALLMEFSPQIRQGIMDGTLKLDLGQIENMFAEVGPDTLAERILGYVNGVPGSGTFNPVQAEAINASLSNARAAYMLKSGRPELIAGARDYEVPEDVVKAIAQAHDDASALPMPKLTEADAVTKASFSDALKTAPVVRQDTAAPQRVLDAYQEWANETRSQYLHMTLGDAKTRVKVQLVKGTPYMKRKVAAKVDGMTKKQFMKEYKRITDVVLSAEKDAEAIPITPEQMAILNSGDWRGFSKARGYTDAEIADYQHYLDMHGGLTGQEMGDIIDLHPIFDAQWADPAGLFDLRFAKHGTPEVPAAFDNAALANDLKRGVVRVSVDDAAHPILTPQQVVEYRAVHTVYGHGVNGYGKDLRGSLNAIGDHAQMYDAEARGAMLSDELGKLTSNYVNPVPVGPKPFTYTDIADAERQLFGDNNPINLNFTYAPLNATHQQIGHIGSELAAADPETQKEVLELTAALRARFPGVRLDGIEIRDLVAQNLGSDRTMAVTIRGLPSMNPGRANMNVVVFGKDMFGPEGKARRAKIISDLDWQRNAPSLDYVKSTAGNNINPEYWGLPDTATVHTIHNAVQPNFLADLERSDPALHETITDALISLQTSGYLHNATDEEAGDIFLWMARGHLPDALIPMREAAETIPDMGDFMKQYPGNPAEALSAYREAIADQKATAMDLKILQSRAKAYALTFDTWVRKLPRRNIPRRVSLDLTFNAGNTLEDVATHEFGHVIYNSIVHFEDFGPDVKKEIMSLQRSFGQSNAREGLSEYAFKNHNEAFAELVSAAYSGDNAPLRAQIAKDFPDTDKWINKIQNVLAKHGVYQEPKTATAAVSKGTLLDSESLRQFTENHMGIGRYSEANPDIGRTSRLYGQWIEKSLMPVLGKTATPAENDAVLAVMRRFGALPEGPATPYNYSEAMLNDLATSAMKAKWKDAYRLQYFQQDRSMLQRSINHPMFGIYPASYMWGKILPEMAKFITVQPFGTHTGAMLGQLVAAQRAVALRREYDPAVDKQIEAVGHNAALSFLGYMLPTIPWDVNAGVPIWLKDIAKQGLQNDINVETGKLVKSPDIATPLKDVASKLVPYTTTIPWAQRAINAMPQPWQAKDVVSMPTEPGGAVQGSDLGGTLTSAMDQLREALSH